MSVELESVKRINNLKEGIEATTGETYTDLTEGVQALKDGYKQGGGGDIGKPYIDTSKITDFSYFCRDNRMNDFIDCIDTSNGTIFNSILTDCSQLTTIPLLNTSKGTSFDSMFYGCSQLTTIPLLDTSNGRNFTYMFYKCSQLTTIPPLDTSNGRNFSSMFRNCSQLTTIPPLDTSNGTSFGYMLYGCSVLETVSLTTAQSDFQTNTFQGCTALKNITIGEGWNVNIYLHYSNNLTVESLHGMIENLADLSGLTSSKVFQIGATNLAKVDEEHIAMLQAKSWNYS